ncbi:hypothetical protein [Pinibacter soli]|uniref:Uncharacterized protein n=1 Tax=Pinibacter soli TaxID=3044211 RepID=A0ABT6RBB0_9BACT|nr:hypothetical protein [Pinibacter soli]MDI3319848.1 hypothetical protein [Pinibacter soli]
MKPILKLFLVLLLFNLTTQIHGQLSMKDPLFCHDKDNYLRCYNDGTYILTFAKGKFNEFRTVNNQMRYSDITRTITFIQKRRDNSGVVDTIQMIQQPKSIILKKGASSLEIASLKNVPEETKNYGISVDTTENWNPKLTFLLDSNYVTVDVGDTWKKWRWDIVIRENDRLFCILYNSSRHNRVSFIFATDNNLKCGTSFSSSFRTEKKIRWINQSYVYRIDREDGKIVIGDLYDGDKGYYYGYNKSGKLKTKKIVGELKLCDCD